MLKITNFISLFLLFLITTFVFFLSSLSSFAGNTDTNIVLSMDDRPPLHYTESDGNLSGEVLNKVLCVLDKTGFEYQIQVVPWKRAQRNVLNGHSDAFFSASKNSERDEYAVLSAPIIDQHWNWYFLSNDENENYSTTPRKEFRVTSWLGSNSQKWLVDNGYHPRPPAHDIKELISLLENNSLDAIFGSNLIIKEAMFSKDVNRKLTVKSQINKPLGVYFSKTFLTKNPDFLNRFNMATKNC